MIMEDALFLSRNDEQEALRKWNDTYKEYPLNKCLHELIAEQVRRNPDRIAVRFGDQEVSYAKLNDYANRSAHYLRGLGIGPDRIVGVLMERSVEMVIALLGILKAGGVYLPLDPAYPGERLLFMLEDAGVSVVFTQDKYRGLVKEFVGTKFSLDSEWDYLAEEPGDDLENMTAPGHLAYVIYTSGSTGKPKGCMLSHMAICNRLLWMQDKYRLTHHDRVLQKTPFTFDVSVWEFFWPLLSGACLVMAKPEGHKDNNYLVDIINREGITTCHFVPSMLRYFIGNPNVSKCNTLRQVFTSGEALPFDLMMDFKGKLSAKLHNLYGPTEAAVDVTYWECEERNDKKVPIGRPISNIKIHILDYDLNQVPIGHEGELHIGGIGLARGYLNRAELTAARFINDPFSTDPGAKLYKTGDMARYLPDGNIEFLGRIDFQVKVRGNRIELGEIEAVLREYESIEDAVVLVRDEASGDPKLTAYVVAAGEDLSPKKVREFVRGKLPDYMVPNVIVQLDAMPVTQHGKLDRQALPWPIKGSAREDQPAKVIGAKISDSISSVLLQHLKGILNTADLSVDDDLFDAGATSFTMVQIVEKIEQLYRVTVPVEVFLDDPTIRAVAEYIGTELGNNKIDILQDSEDSMRVEIKEYGPYREIADTQQVIALHRVDFRDSAYIKGSKRRSIIKEEIPFCVFSRFLSLLKQETIEGVPKYLYPSAGGLNAIQTYLYVKKNAVESIGQGIYYYHPENHTLYLIDALPAIDNTIFYEYDRTVFDNAGFVLFFIAQLEAIKPVYQNASQTLVTLDAGYMGQLLLSRQADFNLGLVPVGGVDFDRISAFFKLDDSHRFIHCLLGGVLSRLSADRIDQDEIVSYIKKTGKDITGHLKDYTGDRTFASFLDMDWKSHMKSMKYLNKEKHDLFHSKHVNIRRFTGGETVVELERCRFPENDYQLRSCRRDCTKKPVSFEQFSKFMSLLKMENKEGQPRYLYPSVSGVYGVEVYLYIREDGIEGVAEGIYYYHPAKHALALITSKLAKKIKPSYTPFNRKQYQNSAFCLFLIGQINAMKPVYKDDSLYFALLEAGYMGQLLMDKQAEFDVGVCPIGGLDFERIRPDFKLDEGQVLLHSFTCGSFKQEIPQERECLEIGRGGAGAEADLCATVSLNMKKRSALQHDIAIVGISGRYPGAGSLDEYWEIIKAGKSSIRELPAERAQMWSQDGAEPANQLTASSRGGFLDDIDCFDNLLFNISFPESRAMDPQERLFMEAVWECLENAGYTAENLMCSSKNVGVFVGSMWSDYQHQNSSISGNRQADWAVAFHSSIANRISYYFNFTGPSVALNTSCSSAMTAVHFACESIKRGECDAAIIGGVNLITHPCHQALLSGLDMLSTDGECRPFGAQTTGWLPGEGVGAILIKPVEDAERDRDYIHGIIKGTAVGHSGRTMRFGAPRSAAQAESILRAIEEAGIAAESISYIEAAAAGASIADASEMNAIQKVFQGNCDPASPCFVGSVKANLGHLESASAMSQITRVLLQMRHRQVAPTIYFKPLNPLIQLQGSGLEIAGELIPWSNHSPLRALVNAFGATGTSGHIIIEEYIHKENKRVNASCPDLIPISAATREQLNQLALRLHDFLIRDGNTTLNISDIGYTLRMGRVEMNERLAIVVENTQGLIERLNMFLRSEAKIDGLFRGTVTQGGESQIIKGDNNKNNLFSIAEQWVQGAAIEWSDFNNGSESRVPLPTYPFAKERHWVNKYPKKNKDKLDSEDNTIQQSLSATTLLKNQNEILKDRLLLTKIENYLKATFSEVSEIPRNRIDINANMEKYGVNSWMITKLNNNLIKDYGELPKTLFFEYKTIQELANYFFCYHRDKSETLFCQSSCNDAESEPLPDFLIQPPNGYHFGQKTTHTLKEKLLYSMKEIIYRIKKQ